MARRSGYLLLTISVSDRYRSSNNDEALKFIIMSSLLLIKGGYGDQKMEKASFTGIWRLRWGERYELQLQQPRHSARGKKE